MEDFRGKKVIVIGGGLSGLAVAKFLLSKGAIVTLADSKKKEAFGSSLDDLIPCGLQLLLDNALPQTAEWNLAVISPGVPPTIPLVNYLKEHQIPFTGELELSYLFAPNKKNIMAVSGTNGKTTTTTLIGRIFQEAGRQVLVGGNIGLPLVDLVEAVEAESLVVAEVSSFQLETAKTFAPHIGVLLNITPDHLDRHVTMANYIAAKEQLIANQNSNDYSVLNYDDPILRAMSSRCHGKAVFFSTQVQLEEGFFVENGQIIIQYNHQKLEVMSVDEVFIQGEHNLANALAAIAVTWLMGVDVAVMQTVLRNFKGVEHRLELFATANGVDFVNDSKGTNPDSTIIALRAYNRPIILVAGGKNKGSDFKPLMELIREKVKLMILIGQAAEELKNTADACGFYNYVMAKDFPEIVDIAVKQSVPGDVVLLSPACASWDMFNNYEERGILFKDLVKERIQHEKIKGQKRNS